MKAFFPKLALAALIGIGSAAAAQAQAVDFKDVKAGAYAVDPYHTQVIFTVSHLGFSRYSGLFSGASGSLELDPAKLAASKLEVSLPIASVLTTSTQLDGELKGDQWFDAAKYATATFTSTKIVPQGKGAATISGNLTMHGVTKPIVLAAHFVGAGSNPMTKAYTVGFEATGTIKRGEFGVKTYIPLVGDDVKLTIAGAFEMKDK